MSDIGSIYRYAWLLFNKAKDYDDINAKESYLQQAWGAANLTEAHNYEGATELDNCI